MNFKQILATVALVCAGAAQADSVTLPGGNLGPLSSAPSLFQASYTSEGLLPFAATYFFSLDGVSNVFGSAASLSELFGQPLSPVFLIGASIDGEDLGALPSATGGLTFSRAALSAGLHSLTVAGLSSMPGTSALTGSVYATAIPQSQSEVLQVPEPTSLAFVLAGLGVVGALSARRRAA